MANWAEQFGMRVLHTGKPPGLFLLTQLGVLVPMMAFPSIAMSVFSVDARTHLFATVFCAALALIFAPESMAPFEIAYGRNGIALRFVWQRPRVYSWSEVSCVRVFGAGQRGEKLLCVDLRDGDRMWLKLYSEILTGPTAQTVARELALWAPKEMQVGIERPSWKMVVRLLGWVSWSYLATSAVIVVLHRPVLYYALVALEMGAIVLVRLLLLAIEPRRRIVVRVGESPSEGVPKAYRLWVEALVHRSVENDSGTQALASNDPGLLSRSDPGGVS